MHACTYMFCNYTGILIGSSKISYSTIIAAIMAAVAVMITIIVLIMAFIVTKRLHGNATRPYSNGSINNVHDIHAKAIENPLFKFESCKNAAYGTKYT